MGQRHAVWVQVQLVRVHYAGRNQFLPQMRGGYDRRQRRVNGKYMRRMELRWVERDYNRLERMRERKEIKEKKKMLRETAESIRGKEVKSNG